MGREVRATRVIPGPIDEVWAVFTDWAGWTDWMGLGKVHVDYTTPEVGQARLAEKCPNGVGAIRVISVAGTNTFEEITLFEAPRRVEYRVIKGGLPMKDHRGFTTFEPEAGGTHTRVTWWATFGSKWPGMTWAWASIAGMVFRGGLKKLDKVFKKKKKTGSQTATAVPVPAVPGDDDRPGGGANRAATSQ